MKQLRNFKKMLKEFKIIRIYAESTTTELTATRPSTWPMNLSSKTESHNYIKRWIRLISRLILMKSLDIKTRRLSEIKNSKSKKFKKQFKKLFKTNFNLKNKIFVKK